MLVFKAPRRHVQKSFLAFFGPKFGRKGSHHVMDACCWFNFNLDRANGRGGSGSQTAADPPRGPSENPEKQTVGTVTASHKTLTLQALSSSLNAGTAKRGCLSRGKAFGSPPAVCPPKLAEVWRGNTIRGNTTRNSERKMALWEGLWEGLWKISENL